MFQPKREDVTGRWRILHNERFIIYTVHHILLGVGYIACMRELRNAYKIYLENLKGREQLGDLGVNVGR